MKGRYLFFGSEGRKPSRYRTVTFRISRELSRILHAMARAEDMSFSQFVGRAIRRQLRIGEAAAVKSLKKFSQTHKEIIRLRTFKGGAK